MREAKTLTADEIAAFRGRRSVFTAEEGNRMFATIEHQREQIKKLRADKREIENAAYERLAALVDREAKRFSGLTHIRLASRIRSLIQPPAQTKGDKND